MKTLTFPFAILFPLALAACGSETTTIPDPTGSPTGTTPTGSPTETTPTGTPPGNTSAIPNGTCALTLVNGATKTRWEGTARVRMNGSGNLRVTCLPKSRDDSRVEVGFGNGTFDGPRTSKGDEVTADGKVEYNTGQKGGLYDSHAKGASCTLVLAEAKLNAFKNEVPRGERMAGTFTCEAFVSTSKDANPKSYAIEKGVVAGIAEP